MIFLNVGYDNLDGNAYVKEKKVNEIKFYRHIYNKKTQCDTIFIFCLVEFGCEFLIPHYLMSAVCSANQGKKIVVIGWYGREFLYKHLCDEFWELDENYMWLRETSRALHHNSKTIKKLELLLKQYGTVYPSYKFGNALLEAVCLKCGAKFGSKNVKNVCSLCLGTEINQSFFAQKEKSKENFKPLPQISWSALEFAKKYEKPNMVGIFARKRTAYGRNLDEHFYKNLINELKKRNFNCVWLGEKQSILQCPDPEILDFSNMPESRNLEYSIAIVSKCVFTIQMWTASTRLSLEANTPFMLVESPDQIYGNGQEGIRLELLNKNNTPNIMLLCNYEKVVSNIGSFSNLILENIKKMEKKEYGTFIGMVDDEEYVQGMMKDKVSL